ncbi:MAG: carbohydrate ABC transporter permease [Promethearchaeota archaeon]
MVFLKESQSRYRIITLVNGLVPLAIILSLYFSESMGVFFYELASCGYLICGWTELLILSTFVSVVPGVSTWTLFYGLDFVGSAGTAILFINVLILVGGFFAILGSFISSEEKSNKHRYYLIIASFLTFPLGILAIFVLLKSKPDKAEKSLQERILTEIKKNKLPYMLIIPFIIFLIFTYLIPIFRGFYITFFGYEDLSKAFTPVDYSKDPLLWTLHAILGGLQHQSPEFIGLDNFFELFSHTTRAGAFQKALNNNVFFVIMFVPGTVIVSLLLAILLNNKFLKGEDSYTTIFYMPVVTSILVVSVIWLRVVFDPDSGLLILIFQMIAPIVELVYLVLNLVTLGIIPAVKVPSSVNWLSDNLMESIALMSIWRRVGFDVLILLAGLKSIPDSLYEAAEIDGHGGWSKFKNITIPMLKGPLGVVIILEIINGWLVFQELYGLNVSGADRTLAIYLIYNYADPQIMTFASTVGYFIFAVSAFTSLVQRVEARGVLKLFSLTCLLSVLFSIPGIRENRDPKSLGFAGILSWLSYDILFFIIALVCLAYYLIVFVIKEREIESDLIGLRNTGLFSLFVSIFFILNGYSTYTKSGFGTNPIGAFPSYIFGVVLIIVGLLMFFADKFEFMLKGKHDFQALMAFGALSIMLANLGWLFAMPLVALLSNELVSIVLSGLVMLLDIFGFFILGIGIIKHDHEDQLACRISGFCFIGWAVLSLIWRFFSPIHTLFPQFGAFDINLTQVTYYLALWLIGQAVPIDLLIIEPIPISISYIFILNGIIMTIGTYFTIKILNINSKYILSFGISNFLGVMLIALPTIIGVKPGDLTDIFFLTMQLGFLVKTILVPILGVLTFWDIFNHYKITNDIESLEKKNTEQRSVIV